MKRKMILPLLAIVFAVASAFTTTLVPQQGWYDSNGPTSGGGVQANITTPPNSEPVCSTMAEAHLCKIFVGGVQKDAFDTKANAEANGATGRLRYDD